ncbi:TetR/AcrR family transcriptional regulator [Haloferax sp. S1W]|uniref:TetR/AcrR family transcriptional regulator n=1 Tax=Haloferax sp. S1W TaxID=3377110 RepID=UPI0037C8C816
MDSDDHTRENDTQSLLMEATYHTLCEYGYAEFSLRKVADEAGKSRGLVHYHYESKNDLLASLLDSLIERFEARFEDSEGTSAIQRLDNILDWVAFGPALFGRDSRDYFMAIFELRAQAPYDEAIRERLTRNYETVRSRVAAVIQAGIDDGELVPVDPQSTATFIVVSVDGARNTDLTLDTDEAVETTLTAIEEFVFESLRTA